MDITLAGRGIILGFTIAAAVGPIALLVIRRTLSSGWLVGIVSGLGVATADGLYGAVAAFGLTAISDGLVALARPLGLHRRGRPRGPGPADRPSRPADVVAREHDDVTRAWRQRTSRRWA